LRRIRVVDYGSAWLSTQDKLYENRHKLVSVEHFCIPYKPYLEDSKRTQIYELVRHVAPQLKYLFFDVEGYSTEQLLDVVQALSPSRLEHLEIGCPSAEFVDLFLTRNWPVLKHIGYVPSCASLQSLSERTGGLTSIGLWTARITKGEARLCVKTLHLLLAKNPALRKVFLESTPFTFSRVKDQEWPNISDAEDESLDQFTPLQAIAGHRPNSNASSVWFTLLLPGGYLRNLNRLSARWERFFNFPLAYVRFSDFSNAWAAQMKTEYVYFDHDRCRTLFKACNDSLPDLERFEMTAVGLHGVWGNIEPNAK
jgi:hypothetical protein